MLISNTNPFLIAQAKNNDATLVTLEKYKENSANIPNICKYFDIECMDLEGLIKQQNWVF